MTDQPDIYFLQSTTQEQQELRRLQLIEADFDHYSQSRLTALGLGPGARCLEAGVGAGSMARWMCEQVGPQGAVVGVDLSDRYFGRSRRPGLSLQQADIRSVELPSGSFDFIHARCFMMHVPGTADVLQRMQSWLKPGGWVLLADFDFSSSVGRTGRASSTTAWCGTRSR